MRTRNGLAGTCWVCAGRVAPRAGWFEKQTDGQYRVRHVQCPVAPERVVEARARLESIRQGAG